jgi:phage terminase large subunit-like protein
MLSLHVGQRGRPNGTAPSSSALGGAVVKGLYVPTRALWYAEFRAELLSFPAGKHDDQVDALSLIGQVLDKKSLHPSRRRNTRA